MQNQNKINLLDTAVPSLGVDPLTPSPFRRAVKSLKTSAAKVANASKLKWNKFYDWLINYVPPTKLIDPSSTINKLKNRIKQLFRSSPHFEAEESQRALKNNLKSYIISGLKYKDPKMYLSDVKLTVMRVIKDNLSQGLKVRLGLKCEMIKVSPNAEGEYIIATPYFNSNMKVILRKDTISEEYIDMLAEIFEKIANFQREGSGWRFRQVIHLEIHMNKYEPLSGSSYIPLPKHLQTKKAIINVQNKNDNQCFKWAITSAIYPVEKNTERLTKYVENSKNLNWDGINFPASLRDVDKFEKLNPTVTVNVFGYEKDIYPLRISKKANPSTVNLLLISEGEINTSPGSRL